MKRFTVAIVALLALTAQVFAAGTIPLSGTQQFDTLGRPLSGGLLYTFQSGTTTPQNAFQDQALTIPYPNPMTLDASGRAPFFYLADGNIKIRLSDSTGVTQVAADGLLVIGPSFGGGAGGGVDPTTILATGDVKVRYGIGTLSGFVRLNGRTLGAATSGATEFANATAQALFEYLWNNDPNLTVSGGRGATSIADWLANKTITLPDMRGRVIAGMDDMGNTAASRLTSTYFATATTLGAAGGSQQANLVQNNVPNYNLSMASVTVSKPNVTITESAHTHANSLNDPTHVHANSLSDPTHVHANSLSDPTHVHGSSLTDPGHTHLATVGNVAAPGSLTSVLLPANTSVGNMGGIVAATTGITLNNAAAATGITLTNSAAATGVTINNAGVGTGMSINNAAATTGITAALATTPTIGGTLPSGGAGFAFSIAPPAMVMTFYQKL